MSATNPAGRATRRSAPITDPRYLVPFILITSLFFMWAFGVNLNDILIPHLKKAFGLTDFQSSFIQVAFFGGYFVAAFPAGKVMERIGYKKGILAGLAICATGALLFIPASSIRVYEVFLFALFVMACGQSFLEVAANPYATILGPAESSERRLNFVQSFNATGAVVASLLGRSLILTGVAYSPTQIASMTAAQLQSYQSAEASTVKLPYMLIAGVFLLVAALIYFTPMPDVVETRDHEEAPGHGGLGSVLSQGHLVKGVIAQFLYVGAQVGVASFVIRFAQHNVPGTSEKTAAAFLFYHLVGFMVGRFAGSAIMKHVPAPRLLAIFAIACLVCAGIALFTTGSIPIWGVVLIGFFHSIMFPTIFALSIKNLGPLTKRGSSLLVMAILGGAIFPALMGKISDTSNIQRAFIVPLICYIYIFYFAVSGYKPAGAAAPIRVMEV
jgi:FHS family L-fucose permease-like MFS transporter